MTDNFNEATIRTFLTTTRAEVGALTPLGHRCSNILEMLENRAKSTDRDQIAKLNADIEIQMRELTDLASSRPKGQP